MPSQPTHRKRGGQPGNQNARTHGAFSTHNASVLTNVATNLKLLRLASARSIATMALSQETASELVDVSRALNTIIQEVVWEPEQDTPTLLAGVALSLQISVFIRSLLLFGFQEQKKQLDLKTAALLALPLIVLDFHRHGISRDAEPDYLSAHQESSFFIVSQKNAQKSDAESLLFSPYITDEQWKWLKFLLPPDPISNSRGRPPVLMRNVLNAIFVRTAEARNWDTLPVQCPPSSTIRRYYSRWYRSGRLRTIYRLLYEDLFWRGHTLPYLLVRDGCFDVNRDHQVILSSECKDSWQVRTACILLQQSYNKLLKIRKEAKNPYFPGSQTMERIISQANEPWQRKQPLKKLLELYEL